MSVINTSDRGYLIVGQVIAAPEPDHSLAGRIKTEAQFDCGDTGWVRISLDGYVPREQTDLTPGDARDLAAHRAADANDSRFTGHADDPGLR